MPCRTSAINKGANVMPFAELPKFQQMFLPRIRPRNKDLGNDAKRISTIFGAHLLKHLQLFAQCSLIVCVFFGLSYAFAFFFCATWLHTNSIAMQSSPRQDPQTVMNEKKTEYPSQQPSI